MQHIIFCPGSKLFVLPVLLIREHIRRKYSTDVAIVASGPSASIFEKLGVGTYPDVEPALGEQRKVTLVFFQHGSDAMSNVFEENVDRVFAIDSERELAISCYSDGFGNASWGQRLDQVYKRKTGVQLSFDKLYTFGFVHESNTKIAESREIEVISLGLLRKLFSDNDVINRHVDRAFSAFPKQRSLIWIPFRPWCTETFHSGVYNFGTEGSLSEIYYELVNIVASDLSRECTIVFRADDRYPDESRKVKVHLSRFWNVVDLDEIYPIWLTLEPLLNQLMLEEDAVYSAMICLDSTSFQTAPFLSTSSSGFKGYLGAPRNLVCSQRGGDEFVRKKLKPKIQDFDRRYQSFRALSSIHSIEKVDETLFVVTV